MIAAEESVPNLSNHCFPKQGGPDSPVDVHVLLVDSPSVIQVG